MFFNSITFLIFLVVVFFLYWFVFNKKLVVQNCLLLVSSYFFYGWWDWRFLFLLLFSTALDYSLGLLIDKAERRRKLYLILGLINNLGVLFFFKYYNFFISAFTELGGKLGFHFSPLLLSIALPVGISFYTFHGMSYVFDVYNRQIKPVKSYIDYSVFVAFFPLLVAGPIERAGHLLPQVQAKRTFNYGQSVAGLRLMLWGFFKKIVIADTLAVPVNMIFNNYEHYSGATLVLGAILFSFQIYGDFSGYTDIALGTAKLFGFELLTNFKFPYFSRNIAEFWRRWHISLSSWFRDYLYIPLGGSKEGKAKAVRNTFIIFLVSGFWHGANWTYIAWGGIHALLFLPLLLAKKNRSYIGDIAAANSKWPSLRELLRITGTFAVVTFAWIFFRSPTIADAIAFIKHIPHALISLPRFIEFLPYVIVLIIADWLQRRNERGVLLIANKWVRYIVYLLLAIIIVFHFSFVNKTQFIYFQF